MGPDRLRIDYTPVPNAVGETLLRPMLPIRLLHGQNSVDAVGLLDSGADVNVLPYSLGLSLGVTWQDQPVVAGLSGNLGSYEARAVVIGAQVSQFAPVRLAFAWTKTDNVRLILGQLNFFQSFDVCFFRSDAVFEIIPK